MKICVKSGIKQLPLFEEEDFPYYEAYIDCDDNISKLLDTPMELVAIHMPSMIRVDNEKYSLNFNGKNEIVEASYNKLMEVLNFSKENDVKFIIIHLGFFNIYSENRFEVLNQISERFNKINSGNVKICVENIPCWVNISFDKEPLLSNEKHLNYFKDKCPNIGFVYDIDHAAINAVFQQFYEPWKKKFLLNSNKTEVQSQLEKEIYNSVTKHTNETKILVQEYIEQELSVLTPEIIHALGSDFCNYFPYNNLPLHGEGLPINFEGVIQGNKVMDRIDHFNWFKQIRNIDDIVITLELVNRESDYNYIEQIKNNWSLMKSSYLKLFKKRI